MALTTTQALLTRLQQEVRDESSTSDTETRLLARLNEAYLELYSGGGLLNDSARGRQAGKPFIFSWAMGQNPIVFNTEAPVTSLTAAISLGSTALTLSSTYASSLTGWFVRLEGDEEVYRIAAHTGGTDAVTLDQEYVNATETAAVMTIFKLDYTIGTDVLLPTNGLVTYFQNEPLPLLDKRESEKVNVVLDAIKGFPDYAYIINNDTVNRTVTIRFDSYTEEPERFELPYIAVPTELDTSSNNPVMPPQHTQILVEYAASLEYDLRDSDSAERYMKRAVDRFRALKAEDRQFSSVQDPNYAKIIAWSRPMNTLHQRNTGGHPRKNRS